MTNKLNAIKNIYNEGKYNYLIVCPSGRSDLGLIKNANEAKEKTEIANEKEVIEQATIQAMRKNRYGNLDKTNLKNSIDNVIGENQVKVYEDQENFSVLFETKRITTKYGYPCKELPNYNVLNIGVLGNRKTKIPSNYYFKLVVNWKEKKVILNIYDKNEALIDTKCSWSFELLQEKLERKLSTLAYIKAERKWNSQERVVYFKYTEVNFYKLKSFDQFIKLLEIGKIKIIFKIGIYKTGKRKGQIHDHGTSFSIKDCNLQFLFDKI